MQRVRSGIDTLIATCESLSKDELAVKLKAIRELPQHNTYVHNVCRKRLLNKARDKDKEEKQSSCSEVPVKRRLSEVRQIEQKFEWKTHCFLCGKLCKRYEQFSTCEMKEKGNAKSTLNSILSLISEECNDHSMSIKRRLSCCSDLPAAEACYHVSWPRSTETKVQEMQNQN